MGNRYLGLLLVLFLAITHPAVGDDLASFSAQVEPGDVRIGEAVTVWVDVKLEEKWHIYSMTTPEGGPYPTEIAIEEGQGFKRVGEPIQPTPTIVEDPNFGVSVEYYDGSVRFGVQTLVTDSAEIGTVPLRGEVTYMLCSDTSCLPPNTYEFELPLQVTSGPPRDAFTFVESPIESIVLEPMDGTGSIVDVDRALNQGLGAFLYLSLSMGFLALLTPCVFPMVPITVSFFTKQEAESRSSSLVKSLVYCGGIISTFTGLGLLLAVTLGASGASQFAANPWVNLFITGIFIAFALSLFGLFEIQLPSSVLTKLNQMQGGSYGAILAMGFTFSLTSFTCTAPFVGTLLVLTSQGDWMWPILGMLVFSGAFALPFFFLSLFPQGLSALPQSGGWLNSVKVVMGFMELAAALKFLSNVDLVWHWGFLSRELFLAAWIAIFITCGIYLLGKIRLPNDSVLESVGPLRLLNSLGCIAFSIYLLTGLFGAPLGELDAFFPPYGSQGAIGQIRGEGEKLDWEDNFETALQEAQATGKPIFVDFTGYACTNCRWMEANIFPDPEIRSLLRRYIRVQLYTDGVGEKYIMNRNFQEDRFGNVALPFYAIVSPDDRDISKFHGLTRDKDLFKRFLQKGFSEELQARTN